MSQFPPEIQGRKHDEQQHRQDDGQLHDGLAAG